ncbi:MAG: stage V sporulation protein AD [Clostridia bacterium]|nr:stage V sporulation protein AD [Clostridia bacterium]
MTDKGTLFFKNKPVIKSAFTIVGPKESQSELGKFFDICLKDDRYGESSYEKAECKMLTMSMKRLIERQKLKDSDVDAIISGDLLNQIISASFSARDFETPFLGVYNACASICEALTLGATLIDGNYAKNTVCSAVSHFATAERQYRYPLELGAIRPAQAQWTVTGAGSYLVSEHLSGYPVISSATIGRVIDFGITDVNNMGAAMAPAACSTITRHLRATNTTTSDYDLIVTGDLGALGSRLLKELAKKQGLDLEPNHVDCGELIYNIDEDEFQGGSGAGCSSVVFASYLYPMLKSKKIKKLLLVATGALLSTLSSQQGESIPGVAHAITVECSND